MKCFEQSYINGNRMKMFTYKCRNTSSYSQWIWYVLYVEGPTFLVSSMLKDLNSEQVMYVKNMLGMLCYVKRSKYQIKPD